jgi:hypothetical protein
MANVRVTAYVDQAIREAYRLSTPERAHIAHEVAAEGRADAPVRSGQYRDGIGVEVNGDTVMVVDNDPEAFYKEYGTEDTPAHAALTDAARRHGRYSGYQPR